MISRPLAVTLLFGLLGCVAHETPAMLPDSVYGWKAKIVEEREVEAQHVTLRLAESARQREVARRQVQERGRLALSSKLNNLTQRLAERELEPRIMGVQDPPRPTARTQRTAARPLKPNETNRQHRATHFVLEVDRRDQYNSCLANFYVYADGMKVGTVTNGALAKFSVPSMGKDKHSFHVAQLGGYAQSESVTAHVEPGESVRFETGPGSPWQWKLVIPLEIANLRVDCLRPIHVYLGADVDVLCDGLHLTSRAPRRVDLGYRVPSKEVVRLTVTGDESWPLFASPIHTPLLCTDADASSRDSTHRHALAQVELAKTYHLPKNRHAVRKCLDAYARDLIAIKRSSDSPEIKTLIEAELAWAQTLHDIATDSIAQDVVVGLLEQSAQSGLSYITGNAVGVAEALAGAGEIALQAGVSAWSRRSRIADAVERCAHARAEAWDGAFGGDWTALYPVEEDWLLRRKLLGPWRMQHSSRRLAEVMYIFATDGGVLRRDDQGDEVLGSYAVEAGQLAIRWPCGELDVAELTQVNRDQILYTTRNTADAPSATSFTMTRP